VFTLFASFSTSAFSRLSSASRSAGVTEQRQLVLFKIELKFAGLTIDGLEQLLALMLPIEVTDPGLFGDNLQFVSGRVTFLQEPAGVAVSIARVPARRPGGVGSAG
jgi:hypothetical protein